jgi:hypothetical protein
MRFHVESRKRTQSENIEYLLEIKFPGGLYPQPLRSYPNRSPNSPSASRLEQIKIERERLSRLPSSEISLLCVAVHDAKYEQAEKELFFNLPAANADFEYWAKMEFWTTEETVALLLGKNPEVVSWGKVQPYLNRVENFLKERQRFGEDAPALDLRPDLATQYERLRKHALRASAFNHSAEKIAPSVAMQWAREYGDISIPQQLTELITTEQIASLVLPIATTQEKPWDAKRANDPDALYGWYTPARYFARELVKEDTTLLTKKDLLANKVAKSLFDVGIKKRGGKKAFDPGTVKKAFVNVDLA